MAERPGEIIHRRRGSSLFFFFKSLFCTLTLSEPNVPTHFSQLLADLVTMT